MKHVAGVIVSGLCAGLLATSAIAQNLSPKEQIDARSRVATAVALAEIAEAEGDADAMLVAARLFSSVGGSVAKRGGDGSEKTFYSVGDVAAAAKALGADAGKADALAGSATSERGICYWDYECGTFECGWLYICE